MINSFEFIDARSWCRLASSVADLIENTNTYLPLFDGEPYQSNLLLSSTDDNTSVMNVVSSNSGLRMADLKDGDMIGGSLIAHLRDVVIKDSSLLLLVDPGLSITEGYGDRRWANYQINTWPEVHNYPLCSVDVGDAGTSKLRMRLKLYSIDTTIRSLPLSAIYLSVRAQDNNIFHWTLEAITRLRCLELVPELRELPIIVRDPLTIFQAEVLRMLGVKNKLIITNGESFKIDNLFFPSIPSPPFLHSESMKWLRSRMLSNLDGISGKKRRIYISRQDSNRRVANEAEIIQMLLGLGFEILVLSALESTEQMRLFRESEIIVLPHGAAGVHLLFAQLEAKVIELHSPNWLNSCYLGLCNSLGISYDAIIGSQIDLGLDYFVDPMRLQFLIEEKITATNDK